MSSVPDVSSSGRIIPAIGKLVRMRLLIAINTFKHAKPIRKFLTLLAGFGVLVLAGVILFLSVLLLNFLNSPDLKKYVGVDVTPFLHVMPVLIFTFLFMGILFTSFGVLLQSLYLSGDMDFLLSSPVPIRAVFVTKLLQAVLPNFGLIALFGLPVLFGLGISGHYKILYYPLVLLSMIAIALAAAGLSSLLVMLVVRVLPPRRAAEILGFFSAILIFTISQAGNLYNSFNHDVQISGQQVNSLITLLLRFNTAWLPLNWAGQGLVAVGEGRWLTGLLLVTLTLAGCTVAFLFALATAERWYYSGWAGMQVITRKKNPTRVVHKAPSAETIPGLEGLIPAPVRAIIWKDALLLRRDLRNLSQLITPLIFGVIYTVMFLRPGSPMTSGTGEMPEWFAGVISTVTTYGNIAMSLFVGWMLLARLSGMAFSSEGKNYWILKSAPLPARYMLVAKFMVAYLPTLALGLLVLIGVSILQKIPLAGFFYSLVALVMCLAGMNGILLTFGVAGANFKWDDPRKMGAGGMGCLGQFLTFLFLPVAFGLFVGPMMLAAAFQWPSIYGYMVGLIAGVIMCLVCAILPPRLIQKRVERLAED
jgi:ABC-2 type transport system permease protein